jgi:hypothetical protein
MTEEEENWRASSNYWMKKYLEENYTCDKLREEIKKLENRLGER